MTLNDDFCFAFDLFVDDYVGSDHWEAPEDNHRRTPTRLSGPAHSGKQLFDIQFCIKQLLSYTYPQYAVKVKRHNMVRGGPLSWIPGMWFTLCKFRL